VRLNRVQQRLEALYDVCCGHSVEDFVLSDRTTAEALAGLDGLGDTPEALLVLEDDEGLSLSLFLEHELLERLRADSPDEILHDGNLNDFLTAVEGVSHFLYLIWNARGGRTVTQLELELQAEVDKFVAAHMLLDHQYGAAAARGLVRKLFSQVRFRNGLTPERLARYRRANGLASRYCAAIESLLGKRRRDPLPLAELRRFYRMPQGRKIRHIEGLEGSLSRNRP
jgi:hypothetical protein